MDNNNSEVMIDTLTPEEIEEPEAIDREFTLESLLIELVLSYGRKF